MKIPYRQIIEQEGLDKRFDFILIKDTKQSAAAAGKKSALIITQDYLMSPFDLVPSGVHGPSQLDLIVGAAEANPDTSFLVAHTCFNIPNHQANLKFVYLAPAWTTISNGSVTHARPVDQKVPAEDRLWLCLNRNRRVHRYLTGMYLLGHGFERYGLLRLDPTDIMMHQDWHTWLYCWQFNQRHEILSAEKCFPILEIGFDKIKAQKGYEPTQYDASPIPGVQSNFEQLRPLYERSLIEIVNSTIWYPDGGAIICEKYIHTVIGYNLPLIVGAMGSVQAIRDQGFDVFDDVLDHSYDTETDPVIRLISVIEKNRRILTDFDHALSCWTACRSRMDHNLSRMRDIERSCIDTVSRRLIDGANTAVFAG